MIGLHFILTFLWLLYGVLHSLLAANYIKKTIQLKIKWSEDKYRLAYNIFALLSLVALIYFQVNIKSIFIFEVTMLSKIIALVIISIGFTIMFLCILKYFGQLSGLKLKDAEPKLEVTGIHKMVRHPLYLGTFVFLAGLFFLFPSVANLLAVTVIISYTIIGIHFEEKKLINKFGNDYIQYRQKVPMIFPIR